MVEIYRALAEVCQFCGDMSHIVFAVLSAVAQNRMSAMAMSAITA